MSLGKEKKRNAIPSSRFSSSVFLMLQRGKLPTQQAAVSCLKSSSRNRKLTKTIQQLDSLKWAAKGQLCSDTGLKCVIKLSNCYSFSSTKANGYSEFDLRDKHGFIENELVSESA